MKQMCFILLFYIFTFSVGEYQAVDELNINNYIGKWYEVYQDNFNKLFQGDGRCSTASYSIINENKISVFNKQIDNKSNKYDEIAGYAYYKDGDSGGYLTVKLEDNPEAPYWVLNLGPVVNDLYDYSIVSDDKGLSLFVLTRDVDKFYDYYNEDVLKFLESAGFTKKYNTPQTMNQNNCTI